MTGGQFSAATAALIEARAKGRCEYCGREAPTWQIHHRRPRGMGGTKRPGTAGAANGVLTHHWCHTRIERERAESREIGFLLYQGDTPEMIPILINQEWVRLNNDGTKDACIGAHDPSMTAEPHE